MRPAGRTNYKYLVLLTAFIAFAVLASAGGMSPYNESGRITEGTISSFSGAAVATGTSSYWHLDRVSAAEAWQVTTGQAAVTIAVLDTGIDDAHPVLEGRVVAEINLTTSPVARDIHGHGTHIAGIIAGGFDELGRVTGIAYDCQLMNVKVANDDGSVDAATAARGIRWAADNGASVINMSFTIFSDTKELRAAVDYAWRRGAVLVAAAGSRFTGLDAYPAMYPNVIAVAATSDNDAPASWSARGDWIDVSAPGTAIMSAAPENQFLARNGTSQSAALVAGEAALLFSLASDGTGADIVTINEMVRQAILASCKESGDGRNAVRLINIYQAVTILSALSA